MNSQNTTAANSHETFHDTGEAIETENFAFSYHLDKYECCRNNENHQLLDVLEISPQNTGRIGTNFWSNQEIKSFNHLQSFLSTTGEKNYKTRIFSVFQSDSRKPLGISEKMLKTLLNFLKVPVEFVEVIWSFRHKFNSAEESFSGHWFSDVSPNHDGRIVSYTFKYPELRSVTQEGEEKWSIRQTGVYQDISFEQHRSTWILIHPRYNSAAHVNLKETMCNIEGVQELMNHPLRQHILLMSTYLSHWRDYIMEYETEVIMTSRVVMGIPPSRELHISVTTLTRLRFIERRLLPLQQIFHSLEETLSGLMELNGIILSQNIITGKHKDDMDRKICNMLRKINAYHQSTRTLLEKTKGVADAASAQLKLKNQYIMQEQSKHLFELTNSSHKQNQLMCDLIQSTKRDVAAVRALSSLTIIIAPISIVVGLFGTAFFYLKPDKTLAVSPQIWIPFVAIFILLIGGIYISKGISRVLERRNDRDIESNGMI